MTCPNNSIKRLYRYTYLHHIIIATLDVMAAWTVATSNPTYNTKDTTTNSENVKVLHLSFGPDIPKMDFENFTCMLGRYFSHQTFPTPTQKSCLGVRSRPGRPSSSPLSRTHCAKRLQIYRVMDGWTIGRLLKVYHNPCKLLWCHHCRLCFLPACWLHSGSFRPATKKQDFDF